MKNAESDLLPELYSRREVDKTRRRQRTLGRVEGVAAVLVVGGIFNFLGWIPTVLVLGVVGYLLYRFLVKPRKSSNDPT